MTKTTPYFAWHNRAKAAHDLLQLVYYAPGNMSIHALELIQMTGSSPSIVWALEDIVLDPSCSWQKRRSALWGIAAAPGNFYFPRLARFATFSPASCGADLNFADVARLMQHHPVNHIWLFSKFEKKSPEIYLDALKTAACFEDNESLPILLIKRLIKQLDQHPYLLDTTLLKQLAFRSGELGKRWLINHIDQVIDLCDKVETRDLFLYVLNKCFFLVREAVVKRPSLGRFLTEYERKIQLQDETEKAKASNAEYLQSPTWKKLYTLYQQGKQNEKATRSLLNIAIDHDFPKPVRVVAVFLLSHLQHQYPWVLGFLCSLLKQYDGSEGKYGGYHAPIRQEVLIALGYAPTPQVWEALIESYFYNPTNSLDWIYPQVVRGVTNDLENNAPLKQRSEPFHVHRLNGEDFHALANIEIALSD